MRVLPVEFFTVCARKARGGEPVAGSGRLRKRLPLLATIFISSLDGLGAAFARANADDIVDAGDKNLAVANFARAGSLLDRF